MRTGWRARVIFVGWTWELHHAVTQSITSSTLRLNCIDHTVTLIVRNVSPMKEPPTNQPMPQFKLQNWKCDQSCSSKIFFALGKMGPKKEFMMKWKCQTLDTHLMLFTDPEGDSCSSIKFYQIRWIKMKRITFGKLKTSLNGNFVYNLQTFQGFCQVIVTTFVANSAWK